LQNNRDGCKTSATKRSRSTRKKIKERLEAKQLIEAENKEDQTRIRCWCERQLTSYTDEDLKSATQKLDGLALRVTDDNLVLLRKRLVGLEQQLEPEEFGDLIHDTFALRLSKAERSALVTKYDIDQTHRLYFNTFFDQTLSDVKRRKERRKADKARKSLKEVEMCQRKEQKLEVLKQKLSTQDRIADFSEINKKVAQHKITVASAKFYESLGPGVVPGCKAWDAHVASVVGSKDKFLLPGAFTELLKKQFEISLSAPELGATVQHYSGGKKGNACIGDFMLDFFQRGLVEAKEQSNARIWRKLRAKHCS